MKLTELESKPEVIDISWPPSQNSWEELFAYNFQKASQNAEIGPARKFIVAKKWRFLRPLISKLKKILYIEIEDSLKEPLARQNEFNEKIIHLIELVKLNQNFLGEKLARVNESRLEFQRAAQKEFEVVKNFIDTASRRLEDLENKWTAGWPRVEQIASALEKNNKRLDQVEKLWQENWPQVAKISETLFGAEKRLDEVEKLWQEKWPEVAKIGENAGQAHQRLDGIERLWAENWPQVAKISETLFGAEKRLDEVEKLWQENWPKVDHLAEEFNKTNERLDISERDWPKLAEGLNKTNERLDILEEDWPKISQIGEAVYQTNERIDSAESRINFLDDDLSEFKKISGRIDHLEEIQQNNWPRVDQLEKLLAKISAEIKENSEQILQNWAQLKKQVSFLEEILPVRDSLNKAGTGQVIASKKILLSDFDYFNFEEEFRGTAEKIKKHQSRYLEYFKNCRNVLDIGSGRGEFLTLLKENNIKSFGVDNNRYAVAAGKKSGLKIIYGQIPEYLRALKEKTLDGVFISHLVEHLEPAVLVELVARLYEKMKKDSCLVIETVNPFSFYALANFYLDLTHIRPIPPKTLEFLAAKNGFKKMKIEWLSPVPQKERLEKFSARNKTLAENFRKIDQTLFGFRDYAIIFKK